jgi:hypothetical protein
MNKLFREEKLNFKAILSVFIVLVSAQVSLAMPVLSPKTLGKIKKQEQTQERKKQIKECREIMKSREKYYMNNNGIIDGIHLYSFKTGKVPHRHSNILPAIGNYTPTQRVTEVTLKCIQLLDIVDKGKIIPAAILDIDKKVLAYIDEKEKITHVVDERLPINEDFEKLFWLTYSRNIWQTKLCEEGMEELIDRYYYTDSYFDAKKNEHTYVVHDTEDYTNVTFLDKDHKLLLCTRLIAKVRKELDVDVYITIKDTGKIAAQYTKDGFKRFLPKKY